MPEWPVRAAFVADEVTEAPVVAVEEELPPQAELEPALELEDSAPGEQPTEEAPAEPVTPEPPKPRTLADIYADVQADKPVSPREYQALQNYYVNQRAEQEAAQKSQAELDNLVPNTRKAMVDAWMEHDGITDSNSVEGLAIQKRVDDALLPAFNKAKDSFTRPILQTAGRQLWEALGKTQEASKYIQQMSYADLIPFAIQLGQNMAGGTPNLATPEEVTTWQEKFDTLGGDKLLKASDAKKIVDAALAFERKANAHRGAPGPRGTSSPNTSNMTYEQYIALPREERRALPAELKNRLAESRMRIVS